MSCNHPEAYNPPENNHISRIKQLDVAVSLVRVFQIDASDQRAETESQLIHHLMEQISQKHRLSIQRNQSTNKINMFSCTEWNMN